VIHFPGGLTVEYGAGHGRDERVAGRYVDLEDRIPARHPLRKIRQNFNDALASLDGDFDVLYSTEGCPSIAPERRLCASLIQILFSVRSRRRRAFGTTRQLMEQMQYNLMFRWFAGLWHR
jgi:transposase